MYVMLFGCVIFKFVDMEIYFLYLVVGALFVLMISGCKSCVFWVCCRYHAEFWNFKYTYSSLAPDVCSRCGASL